MSNPPSHPLPTSTYPIEKLLQLWRNEALTADQAIGQRSTERSRRSLLQHVAWLEAHGPTRPKPEQRQPTTAPSAGKS